MHTTITKILSSGFLFFFSLIAIQPVFAHGDDARIEINPERLNPGGVLEIRGVGFEPEAEITLSLVASQADFSLGVVTTDPEGVFQLTTTLPVDLVDGAYMIRGTTEDGHTIDSPELTIWGSADLGSADGQPREEEDALLAPMPTIAAGAPTPQMASAPIKETGPVETASIPYGWIGGAVGLALIAITILVLRLRR